MNKEIVYLIIIGFTLIGIFLFILMYIIDHRIKNRLRTKSFYTKSPTRKQHTLKEAFIEGYKQRAVSEDKIFDRFSRSYAIALFNKWVKEPKN